MSGDAHGVTRTAEELDAWRRVAGASEETDPGAGRLAAIGAHLSVAEIATLRKDFPPAWVAAALEWARARPKAEAKWPGRRVVCDVPGIEMASGERVARAKAAAFEAAGGGALDLCCGVGGDLMALAASSGEGVELDPLRAWMAAENSGQSVRTADATRLDLAGRLVHFDPARRDGAGRRTIRYEDLEPGPAFVERVARESLGAAVKLMPGVDPGVLPTGHVEYISEGGRLTQAVLWTGVLAGAHGRTSARLLGPGLDERVEGYPVDPPHRPIGDWVFAADASVERAGLLGVLCERLGLGMPHPRAGVLTGDGPVESAWVTGFEVISEMAWNRKRVRGLLREAGAGVVEVKTRGGVVDADAESRALRGDGARTLTVFVVRMGANGVRAIVCARASSVHPDTW